MGAKEFELNDKQKSLLLTLARGVVESQVKRKPEQAPDLTDDPKLNLPCGCFVTLHVSGHLRGCIGTFESDTPLWQTVRNMATAALQDPRFLNQPIREKEMDMLDIEISVLSPLQQTDDPMSLQLGKHGIYIKHGYQTGCFLPQVAEETGWSKEEFLSYCCSHKAGLPGNAWKDKSTNVYLFTAEVFSEKDLTDLSE